VTEQTRRATRLIEIERRLRRNPGGLTVAQLAEATGYSKRTIQRDLNALESELGAPLVEGPGRRWRLLPGSTPIGVVRFSLQEARAIFLAARLLFRHADERDSDGISALEKLADALPPALAKPVETTVEQLKRRPDNPGQQKVLRELTEAWANSQTVRIRYNSQTAKDIRETDLDPYLLEPSWMGSATYVIGYSHEHQEVRTFKVDRIIKVTQTGQQFQPVEVDELWDKVGRSWVVVFGDDQYDVVIDFSPSVAERIKETIWHPSQRLTKLDDGGVRLELRLPSLLEFVPWVRSWGHAAKVVAPDELRKEVAESLRKAAAQYD